MQVPAALNGFGLWNAIVLVLMIVSLWLSDRPVLLPQTAFRSGRRGDKPRLGDDRSTMMARDRGPFKLHNPWPRIAWSIDGWAVDHGRILGFLMLGRDQQNGPPWGLGSRSAGRSALPPISVPPASLSRRCARRRASPGPAPRSREWQAASAEHGAFVALNCTACHGEQGVSQSGAVSHTRRDGLGGDLQAARRFSLWQAVVGRHERDRKALLAAGSADVAAYFATRRDGLPPGPAKRFQQAHTCGETNPAIRLVFAGDPARGIPPCAACHGPGGHKLGAPPLKTQQPAYIERQLAAFAQGIRQNDMNEQMRTIAEQLTSEEMHLIAGVLWRGCSDRPGRGTLVAGSGAGLPVDRAR